MRLRTWSGDLFSGGWLVFGVVAAALTVAAIFTELTGHHVAAPWLIVAALLFLVASVFVAYTRAASTRDQLAIQVGRKHDYISREEHARDLDSVRTHYIDKGDGTYEVITTAELRAAGREVPD